MDDFTKNILRKYRYYGLKSALNAIAWGGIDVDVYNAYAFSISNTTQKNYLNGSIKTATNSYSRSDSASSTIHVARGVTPGADGYLNGYMLGYLHYNSQLTDAEVAQNVAVFSSRY
jgi:hypothetical protein